MLKFIISAKGKEDFPLDLCDVVFVGRSNVGKSSLLNAVYGQRIAYVGKKPGMTKMINFFSVDNRYYAVDVPGYGYAARSAAGIKAFGKMMDDYFSEYKRIALVVMIVDSRHKPTRDDIDMIELLRLYHLKVVIVASKVDKLKSNDISKQMDLIADTLSVPKSSIIKTSVLKKKGIDELKSYIDSVFDSPKS